MNGDGGNQIINTREYPNFGNGIHPIPFNLLSIGFSLYAYNPYQFPCQHAIIKRFVILF